MLVLRRLLIFWTLFNGLGAVVGATGMILDTTGKAMGMVTLLPFFQKLPLAGLLFQDFLFPGIALLLVIAIPNLSAFVLLWKKSNWGSRAGAVCGIILMLWICIQFYLFPFNALSTAYFIFGLLQALTGARLYAKETMDQRVF